MAFSEKLIEARKKACLSQQQLSRLSGISQQAISKLENGKSSPSEYTMRQLAAALHIPLSELIDEKKEEMDQADWLMQDVLHRVHHLSEPALTRLSDLLNSICRICSASCAASRSVHCEIRLISSAFIMHF